jgi:hypothetical protein
MHSEFFRNAIKTSISRPAHHDVMEVPMRAAVLMLLLMSVALSVSAQTVSGDVTIPPPRLKAVGLAGPRFGLTALSDGVVDKLHERSIDVRSTISQFGWQFEKQFYSRTSGPAVVNEWVVLLGGLEQGHALPSLSWLVGLRSRTGAEFGLGPNITPVGIALALAGGVTLRSGSLNVPVTIAVVPSKAGTRVSMLTGFSLRR